MVNGICPDGHILHWQSQEMVRGMAAGNLLLPATILLCGHTFTSIVNLAYVFNLAVTTYVATVVKGIFIVYNRNICIL